MNTAPTSENDRLGPRSGLLRAILSAQAVYYIVFGLWPLVHMPSFLELTGPKQDLWLVVTVGAVLAAVGVALAVGRARRLPTVETATLAVAVALVLAAVESVYVALGRIPPIYLADAAVEVLLIAGVLIGWTRAYGAFQAPPTQAHPAAESHVIAQTRR